MQTATHPHLFRELRKRNERRARVARLLEARRDRSPQLNRVVQLHRLQRKAS
jgi:hypothetical protein